MIRLLSDQAGGWGSWGGWSTNDFCIYTRTRECDNPKPCGAGKCYGESSGEEDRCYGKSIPSHTKALNAQQSKL